MCGKYTLIVGKINENLRKMVELCSRTSNNTYGIIMKVDGEIRPNDAAPALMMVDGRVNAVPMRWGFERSDGRSIINARSENASECATFRGLVDKNICVLPAAGYYEWRDTDHLKHLITPTDADGFYLAGLYRMDETGALRFVVLTRAAFGEHAQIHGRMPLLVTSGDRVRQWLSGQLSLEALADFTPEGLSIRPLEPEQLSMDFSAQSDT